MDFVRATAELFSADVSSIQMVSNGVNKNLRVSSPTGNAFVRFSPTSLHSKSGLLGEAKLLAEGSSVALPCCEPIRRRDTLIGGPITIENLNYHWLITRGVVGRTLKPTTEDANAFGRSLARIHSFRGIIPDQSSVGHPLFNDRLESQYDTILDAYLRLPMGHSSRGLCHGDAWLGNGLWTGSEVILIDFEWAGNGAHINDIATFAWSIFEPSSPYPLDLFEAFLNGYSSVCAPAFNEAALRRAILGKELQNLEFVRRYIFHSNLIVEATLASSQAVLHFALGNDLYGLSAAFVP